MAKRLKLEIEFESTYQMLGIATTLSDFSLAHHLGDAIGQKFCQEAEIHFSLRSGEMSLPLFFASDNRNHLDYFLLPNKQSGAVLFPSERRFDYWLVCGGEGDPEMQVLAKDIQKVKGVQFCFAMDAGKIKESSIFFEDLELGTAELVRKHKGSVSGEDALW